MSALQARQRSTGFRLAKEEAAALDPGSPSSSSQRGLDGVQQRSFAEWLPQEILRTSSDGLRPFLLGRTGGDKNDRNRFAGASQILLQFQAVNPGHPEIEY